VLGQVSGDKKAVLGISNWHIHNDGHSVVLHDVLCMPDNPSCTLSTSALKRLDGFVYAAHDAIAQLQLVCPLGIDKSFHTKDNTLKSLNGLDYVPMITLLPQESEIDAGYENCEGPPDPNVDPDSGENMCANAASLQLPRRSNQIKRLPMKFLRPMPIENTSPPIKTKPPKIVNCKDTKRMNIDDASSIASPYLTSPIPATISQIPRHQSSSTLPCDCVNKKYSFRFCIRQLRSTFLD